MIDQFEPSFDTAASSRRSVLVVEDNPAVRLLLARTLKNTYEVETAATYDEAMALVAARRFDIIVLDINLGDPRDGVDLLHEIRRDPAYREVPAVACTAYARGVERKRFLREGFDEFVSKPFTKQTLLAAMARTQGVEDETVIPTEVVKQRPPVHRTIAEQVVDGERIVRRLV